MVKPLMNNHLIKKDIASRSKEHTMVLGFLAVVLGILFTNYLMPRICQQLGITVWLKQIVEQDLVSTLFWYWLISLVAKTTLFFDGLLGTIAFYSLINKALGYWESFIFGMTCVAPLTTFLCWWFGTHSDRIPFVKKLKTNVFKHYRIIGKNTLEYNFFLTVFIIFSLHYNVISYIAGFSGVRLSFLMKALFVGQSCRYLVFLHRDMLFGKTQLTNAESIFYGAMNILPWVLTSICMILITYVSHKYNKKLHTEPLRILQ
jgi:hypothetical protein